MNEMSNTESYPSPSKADLGGRNTSNNSERFKRAGFEVHKGSTGNKTVTIDLIIKGLTSVSNHAKQVSQFRISELASEVVSHLYQVRDNCFGRRVAKWFDDRKITQNATLDAQMGKLREEFGELDQGIEDNDLEEIKDGIGDCAVVLAGMAHMCGMTFEECCEHAWNEIKDRTGHLNEEGVFVKD